MNPIGKDRHSITINGKLSDNTNGTIKTDSKYIGSSRERPQAECLARSGERKLED